MQGNWIAIETRMPPMTDLWGNPKSKDSGVSSPPILICDGKNRVYVGTYSKMRDETAVWSTDEGLYIRNPTHWQPALPPRRK